MKVSKHLRYAKRLDTASLQTRWPQPSQSEIARSACVQEVSFTYNWRIGRTVRLFAKYALHLIFRRFVHGSREAIELVFLSCEAFCPGQRWTRVFNGKEVERYLCSGIFLEEAMAVHCAFDIISDFCLAREAVKRRRKRCLDMSSCWSGDLHAHEHRLVQAVCCTIIVERDLQNISIQARESMVHYV